MRKEYYFDLLFSFAFSAAIVAGLTLAFAHKWIDATSAIAGLISFNFASIARLEAQINRIERRHDRR